MLLQESKSSVNKALKAFMVYHHVFTSLPFILILFISFGLKPRPLKDFCGGLAIFKFRERLLESRSFPPRETQFVLLNFVFISFIC